MTLTKAAIFAAGYFFGARAGRERYAQIVEVAARASQTLEELLDATIALVPADVTGGAPAVGDGARRVDRAAHASAGPSGSSGWRSGPVGHGLADAVRNLDQGAKVLAEVRRNGA